MRARENSGLPPAPPSPTKPKSAASPSAYNAALVDMEAAAVARLAAMRGIPFYCIKGVSDGLNRSPALTSTDFSRPPASSSSRGLLFLPSSGPGTGPHSSGWAKIVKRLPKASRSHCSIFSTNEVTTANRMATQISTPETSDRYQDPRHHARRRLPRHQRHAP